MKRYKDYMDGVEVSDTLHEKLSNLEEPKKRPQPWAKWGAMAAAAALVVGVGAWGLSRGAVLDSPNPLLSDVDAARAELEEIGGPDIANEEHDGDFTATPSGGGYEVQFGVGDDTMVAYYLLPALNWADASAQSQTAADYALAPPSAVSRGAALEDVRAFAGGEKAMADHLLWDGLDWDGLFWFLEDGTPHAASLYASGDHLELFLEVMKGGEVPSCIVLPEDSYERGAWGGVEITALKNGGYAVIDGVELRENREVSFFFDGAGYKLTLYTDDAARADELCARFVRYAVDGGFRLDALSTGGVLDCSYYAVGEPNWEDGFYCDCPDCIESTVHSHSYDPDMTAEAKAPTPSN